MKWIPFLLLLFACSCKHEADSSGHHAFTLLPATATVFTGDSILLYPSRSGVDTWTLIPEVGRVTTALYYKAPSSLASDSLHVEVLAKSGMEQAAIKLLLVKKDPTDTLIRFSQTILPLMSGNCNFSGCHGNGSAAGRVELSNYANTMQHVYPGQPEKSLLYLSLVKPDPLRRMPPAGSLHHYRIDYVKKWIEQGAHNN